MCSVCGICFPRSKSKSVITVWKKVQFKSNMFFLQCLCKQHGIFYRYSTVCNRMP